LVHAAVELAAMFGLADRVDFEHTMFGAAAEHPHAEAYYLFNPFGENLYAVADRMDNTVETSHPRFVREVLAVQQLLRAVPDGTLLLTYHGYGGPIPREYELVRTDPQLNALKLWRKGPPASAR
jgi:hypothetical protein